MNRFILRLVAPLLAMLAVVALAGPLQAAPVPFNALGTFTTTAKQGPNSAGTLGGTATPGGVFKGVFSQRATGQSLAGTTTFDFGGGTTLTMSYQITYDRQ